mgnify:CR=1 FL=1
MQNKNGRLALAAVGATLVFGTATATETQEAFANGDTLAGDLVLRAKDVGDSATFRATGSFSMPAVDEARGEWPVGFFSGNGGTPVLGLHATTDAARKGAVFAAKDAVASISLPQAGTPEVVFEKGQFNFRDPGGTATGNALELMGGDRTVRILSDADVRAGAVVNSKPLYTNGTRSLLEIKGELNAADDFDFSLDGYATATASVAVVEGGRLAVAGGFSLGKGSLANDGFTHSWPTLALTNGTLAVGSLTFTHGAIRSKDARVEIAGDFKYGMGGGWKQTARMIDWRGGSLAVGGKFSVQGLDETLSLTDVAASVSETFIAEAGTPCLRLAGGSYAAGKSFLLGKTGNANAVLEHGAVLSFASGCEATIGGGARLQDSAWCAAGAEDDVRHVRPGSRDRPLPGGDRRVLQASAPGGGGLRGRIRANGGFAVSLRHERRVRRGRHHHLRHGGGRRQGGAGRVAAG